MIQEGRTAEIEKEGEPDRIIPSPQSRYKGTPADPTYLDTLGREPPSQALQGLANSGEQQRQDEGPFYAQNTPIRTTENVPTGISARVRNEIMGELDNMPENSEVQVNNQPLKLRDLKQEIIKQIQASNLDPDQIARLSQQYEAEIEAFRKKYKETLQSRELKLTPNEDIIDKLANSMKILARFSLIAGTAYLSGGQPLFLAGSAAFLARDIFFMLNDPKRFDRNQRREMIDRIKETLNAEEQRLAQILDAYGEGTTTAHDLENLAEGKAPLTQEEIEHGLSAIKVFNEQFDKISTEARIRGSKS